MMAAEIEVGGHPVSFPAGEGIRFRYQDPGQSSYWEFEFNSSYPQYVDVVRYDGGLSGLIHTIDENGQVYPTVNTWLILSADAKKFVEKLIKMKAFL